MDDDEIALAQKCTALIGEHEVLSRKLAKFSASCSGFANHTVIKAARFAHEHGVCVWRRGSTLQRDRNLAFLEILKITSTFGCVDDKDRLFAVLPLIFEKVPPSLVAPDYNKTLAFVLADSTWYLLNTEHSEQLLFIVVGCHGHSSLSPSWTLCLGRTSPFVGRIKEHTIAAIFQPSAGISDLRHDIRLERLMPYVISLRGIVANTRAGPCLYDAALSRSIMESVYLHPDEICGYGVSGAAILSRVELTPGDAVYTDLTKLGNWSASVLIQ
ncbi:hypothetical protein K431DRAFT_291735 [Polychaeton citri CBS 116435]|uniref:Uncharacterized protein n=1 Tax=Polychaeton citri CBS 116435 TaxID=1314669 RepID=A0A9P4QBM7_9PEZI|nr:hypothetical protein K431DRAFT_291735 [Polychaeton citri CBS 116435]